MSKRIAMIPLSEVRRIAVIKGRGRTLAQLKGNADYIINGGFYDMDTGKAVGHLKADGTVMAKEAWSTWGFVWDSGADVKMVAVPKEDWKNYISGVELITPSKTLSYVKEVGGSRGRTAMGLTDDSLILYCSGDGTKDAKTPESLRDELAAMGAKSAIMLDGGGSSQCDFPEGKISSARRVHNYIAVWLKKEKEKTPMGKKVVLDPGHGVETAGKRSPDKSYFEHEFALDMACRLKAQLERHGVEVVLTRSDEHDVELEQRVKHSNKISPDLFVSLHSNASGDGSGWTDPDGYGIYTSSAGNTAGRNVAARAILAMAEEAGLKLWGGGLHHERFYVLRKTDAPAVLIEHGFHTNINEVQLLKTDVYRDLLARVDAKGILDYLGIAWKDDKKPTNTASEWARESWEKAVGKGIFDGTAPKEVLTREQAAVVLERLGLLD